MIKGIQRFWAAADDALPIIQRAKGLHLWDESGRRYIDVTSGPIAVNIGHGNERVLAAMEEQAQRVCFAYPSNFENRRSTELNEHLAAMAGPGLECAFFVSSGSEAVEKCLQFARRVAIARGETARHKVISRDPSYHGSTQRTMALSADPAYAPYLADEAKGYYVPAPSSYRPPRGVTADAYALQCAEALRARILDEGPDTVLAFILEPIMGFCGGADRAPAQYYQRVRKICDEFGVLLIYDEIISGAGRSGHFLAADAWSDARPDLVVLAKGLGGGYFPLAAFLAPAVLVDTVAANGGFQVGHTHKAQPLACAVGLAVLKETVEQNLIERSRESGVYLRAQLSKLKADTGIIGDVRGLGLLNAVEIVADQSTQQMLPRDLDVVGRIQTLARDQGLLIYGRRTHAGRFGDWIMVAPPLIASHQDIDEIVYGLGQSLKKFQRECRVGVNDAP